MISLNFGNILSFYWQNMQFKKCEYGRKSSRHILVYRQTTGKHLFRCLTVRLIPIFNM